jgi:hypothetical protein
VKHTELIVWETAATSWGTWLRRGSTTGKAH